MTRSCTGRWGARRSSSPRNGEWTKRRPRGSPTRSLLIYHSYSGRGRKRELAARRAAVHLEVPEDHRPLLAGGLCDVDAPQDRKSTRLNSSHLVISYAVFCLKKKKKKKKRLNSSPISRAPTRTYSSTRT